MSKRMNSQWVVVLFGLNLFVSISISVPEGWVIQQISSGGMVPVLAPAVDGDQVAYIDSNQIMLWTVGQQSRLVSTRQNQPTDLRLSSGKVAWLETNDQDKSKVMFWDGVTTQQLSTGQYFCGDIQISEGNL